jgi:hypothetical protein
MSKILIIIYSMIVFEAIGFIYLFIDIDKANPTEKLYFEFRKKDSSVTADGFLRYKGKWCPIVLNDSIAVIYQ